MVSRLEEISMSSRTTTARMNRRVLSDIQLLRVEAQHTARANGKDIIGTEGDRKVEESAADSVVRPSCAGTRPHLYQLRAAAQLRFSAAAFVKVVDETICCHYHHRSEVVGGVVQDLSPYWVLLELCPSVGGSQDGIFEIRGCTTGL